MNVQQGKASIWPSNLGQHNDGPIGYRGKARGEGLEAFRLLTSAPHLYSFHYQTWQFPFYLYISLFHLNHRRLLLGAAWVVLLGLPLQSVTEATPQPMGRIAME